MVKCPLVINRPLKVSTSGQANFFSPKKVYGPDGHFKCDLEFNEKIVRPSDICVDDHGFLYVTCFIQHCIKKYRLVTD